MLAQWTRPVPPGSATSLADAWARAASVLPSDRWLSIRSEYGDTAYWIALALAPEEFDPLEVVGTDSEGPAAVLDRLASTAAGRAFEPATVPGVVTRDQGVGSRGLGDVLAEMAAALPDGWWLQGIEGCEGRGSPPGWLAIANGGPDSG